MEIVLGIFMAVGVGVLLFYLKKGKKRDPFRCGTCGKMGVSQGKAEANGRGVFYIPLKCSDGHRWKVKSPIQHSSVLAS